jgi:hypothetical protein
MPAWLVAFKCHLHSQQQHAPMHGVQSVCAGMPVTKRLLACCSTLFFGCQASVVADKRENLHTCSCDLTLSC